MSLSARLRAAAASVRGVGDGAVLLGLIGFVLAAALLVGGTVRVARHLDEARAADETLVAAHAAGDVLRTLSKNAHDYAWWDDAVAHLAAGDPDADWGDSNIGRFMHDTWGYTQVLVTDSAGRVRYAYVDGARADPAAVAVPFPAELRELLARAGGATTEPLAAGGWARAGDRVLAVAAARLLPVTAPAAATPPPAFLVLGGPLDAAFFSQAEGELRLAGVRLAPDGPATDEAALWLRTPAGLPAAAIAWQPSRPGTAELVAAAPVTGAALLTLAGFAGLAVARLRRALAGMRASECRFRDVAEAASDWIWETDAGGRVTFLSGGIRHGTGGTEPSSVLGRPLADLLGLGPAERRALADGGAFRDVAGRLDLGCGGAGGGARTLRVAGRPVRGQGGALLGHRGTATDVTAEVEATARVRYLADHDALTGLPNRAVMDRRIGRALALARRRGDRFAVLALDLDRFKAVNDTLGHPAGDALLRAVAGRLRDCLREADTAARLGGDEFAVLQAGIGRAEDAAALAERLAEALSAPYDVSGHAVIVGVSIGVAVGPDDADGDDADDGDADAAGALLRRADVALYRAKTEGRGAYRFFEPGMEAALLARRRLELDLREALATAAFGLHYQPLVGLRTGRVVGFEALLRWAHPTRGMVPPSEFVPLAEEMGLIVPLGAWVLRRACADAAAWPGGIKVAVNLSPAQVGEGLVASVAGALAASGLPAARLELEITETVLLGDAAATLAVLGGLRGLGVRIAMDDFGTGYSSLGYLRSFPFDKIKIDGSFVRDLGSSADCEAIVRAVTGLGGSLGIATTAEGVETREQLERLRAEGCDEAQGFYLGRPMPAVEVPRFLGAEAAASLSGRALPEIRSPAHAAA